MTLRLRHIVLPLNDFTLELDLELHGRLTGIFGPSGAGKTSLLDLIAGLRQPKSAFIQLEDSVLTDTAGRQFVPTRRRRIGYVPQDLALFPHLSVRQNLRYGYRPGGDRDPTFSFEHVTDLLGIKSLTERGIDHLSGGEKQRVALARALLSSPRLLLLDEPLASLDQKLKQRILPYFNLIGDEFKVPILYVTHDANEARALCEEVIVLDRGKVTRRGDAAAVLQEI